MYKILMIEDEANMASFIEMELKYEGYEVEVADNGRKGLELALSKEYDVILLDVMLPGMNGLEVCRRLLEVKYVPIIMLTARDHVMDKVTGLQAGAEDYLPKPFAIEELLVRIQVILRRENKRKIAIALTHKDISLNFEARTVSCGETYVELTNTEFELLAALMRSPNKVLSRDVLLEQVWGYHTGIETNVVDVYIRYIRNKLDANEKEKYIQTVRGVGYVMRL